MITKLSVANFKSVRHLDIDCKKINLFIGEPNTGKSNILEALALLSWCGQRGSSALSDFVRYQSVQYLFYDGLLDNPLEIDVSTMTTSSIGLRVKFTGQKYDLYSLDSDRPFRQIDKTGRHGAPRALGQVQFIKFFRFGKVGRYDEDRPGSLEPPRGRNLFSVVYASELLRETMKEFFIKYGLKLVMKPHERQFELVKHANDLLISYPYTMTSDTLQRIIFYTVAMASNQDSTLVFEEPESNAFPYYTKYLGERIALDETNQFFIATHNPYLLSAVIEKAPKDDVQVFVTYFQDYETCVKPLTTEQLGELMEADPFFNLDHFLEDAS